MDFLKLLHEKLQELHLQYADTVLAARFPRPSFKVVVLYVDEETSVQRQLQRAAVAHAHNRRIMDAGAGPHRLREARATDVSLDKVRKRYQIFRQHYSAILRLKQFFPFHLIDAMGSLADTQEQIAQEVRYQSSLDLSEETYSAIRHLPQAKDLQRTARQQLVGRLENYCQKQRPLFGQVLAMIDSQVVPLLKQGGLPGQAEWCTEEPLLTAHPVCVDMVMDVLSDRGFQVSYVRDAQVVPTHFDVKTGKITTEKVSLHRFRVSFEAPGTRDAAALKTMELATRVAEAARSGFNTYSQDVAVPGAPITESFIPQHCDHERRLQAKGGDQEDHTTGRELQQEEEEQEVYQAVGGV